MIRRMNCIGRRTLKQHTVVWKIFVVKIFSQSSQKNENFTREINTTRPVLRSAASWLFHARWLFSPRYLQPRTVMKPLYSKKKWGAHKRYSASVRAELGRYASHHGVAASSSLFFKEATCSLSNSCLPDFTINVIATNTQLFRTRPSCLRARYIFPVINFRGWLQKKIFFYHENFPNYGSEFTMWNALLFLLSQRKITDIMYDVMPYIEGDHMII